MTDHAVVPRDSSWFSFHDGKTLVPIKDQPIYQEDWIGLRELDESGRLVFSEITGHHMQFTFDWFEQNIINTYLQGTI